MTQPEPRHATYKRIIICSDGTWLASDTGDKSIPSNVAKIARAIAPCGLDANGNIVKQIVFYHSGLGTGDLPFQKAIYGGLGWGLDVDVCHLYDFISNNYQSGDELLFFGFSRGAFTVRSVASLVCDIGVLSAVHMSHFAEMWRAYRANSSGEPFSNTSWYRDNVNKLFKPDVRIKVVGVWDTVGALGIPEWPFVEQAMKIGLPINKEYAFHDTKVSNMVDYAFQALALDEKRITFPPTLWHRTADSPAIDLQQCWFPGVHGNIGGQAEMPRALGDYEEIGDNTFAWMVDNCSGMLTFEESSINVIIDHHQHALNSIHIANGWGCGPIVDNFSGLQGAFFKLLGMQYRTPGDYPRDPGDGVNGATNEFFHPIVRVRKRKLSDYDPPSMKGFSLQEPDGKEGWKWVKNGVQPVPEYTLYSQKTMSLSYEEGGKLCYKTGKSLSRLLCAKDILLELDSIHGQVAE